jgi:hypothetical protein
MTADATCLLPIPTQVPLFAGWVARYPKPLGVLLATESAEARSAFVPYKGFRSRG